MRREPDPGQAHLTGESEPQGKAPAQHDPPAAENRFFAGSQVLSGHGYGEITGTGGQTQYGKIAALTAAAGFAPTPLQAQTARLIRQFTAVAIGLAAALVLLETLRGTPLPAALLAALSLGMAAVPEEYALVFALFLSLGAWRLARGGLLVRRMVSVETLGSTTSVDKTGTLTRGEFALEAHLPLGAGLTNEALLEAAVLACEPRPADTLERAIVAHCREHGVQPERLYDAWRLCCDYPFEPVGKHMAHIWEEVETGAGRLIAKGAGEGILEHCRLSEPERREAEAAVASLSNQGMRVLAVAGSQRRPENPFLGQRTADEADLQLNGLLGFRDPLRSEAPAAIAECQQAGIRVQLITGDHLLTAHAVAEAAGVTHDHGALLT
ncbi:MAG: cation-transporting P-type ATPase, partial [Armatimonadetes bacterium]|nr:cation-transporting P-type ATPase [Armatimonadota bacterium]